MVSCEHFKEEFAQLLSIQLFGAYPIEVHPKEPIVTININNTVDISSLVFHIRDCSIVCYNRLIYRRRLGEMGVPLAVVLKNDVSSATIRLDPKKPTKISRSGL